MSVEGTTEQTGQVVVVEDGFVRVQVVGGGCGRCHEQGGCGAQQLTRMFCSTPRQYRLANTLGARQGDLVTIVVPPGVLGRYATLAYGVPVVGLLGGALAGDLFAGNLGAILGSGLGLRVSWLVLRTRYQFLVGKTECRPYISRVKSCGG